MAVAVATQYEIGMPGCALSVDGLVALPAPTNASGLGSVRLSVGRELTSVGLTFHAQALLADAGANPFGVIVSNALSLVVGCP